MAVFLHFVVFNYYCMLAVYFKDTRFYLFNLQTKLRHTVRPARCCG